LESKLDRVPSRGLTFRRWNQSEAQALLHSNRPSTERRVCDRHESQCGGAGASPAMAQGIFCESYAPVIGRSRLKFLFNRQLQRASVMFKVSLTRLPLMGAKEGERILIWRESFLSGSLAGLLAASDLLYFKMNSGRCIWLCLGCTYRFFFGPETPVLYGPLGKEREFSSKNLLAAPVSMSTITSGLSAGTKATYVLSGHPCGRSGQRSVQAADE